MCVRHRVDASSTRQCNSTRTNELMDDSFLGGQLSLFHALGWCRVLQSPVVITLMSYLISIIDPSGYPSISSLPFIWGSAVRTSVSSATFPAAAGGPWGVSRPDETYRPSRLFWVCPGSEEGAQVEDSDFSLLYLQSHSLVTTKAGDHRWSSASPSPQRRHYC